MNKKLNLLLIILIPIICLIIAGIPFTLADYPETQTEQTMNGTSAENTGASSADKSFKGGALYISNGASYTMTGGSIAGKTNQYGGAVYVTNGSTFTMAGGTITGCSALYGGAIYVEAGGTCNITGGTITGNKAQFAPAIYVEDGGILNVDQTAVIKDNEYEKYGNPLEIYVDGALAKTMYMKEDTYTISEADMPLQYENCCGYFLDEKLSQCSFGEVALTSEAKGFASRTADAEKYIARLYTRTANPDNFKFLWNKDLQSYDIEANNKNISGHIVLPKQYKDVKTTIHATERRYVNDYCAFQGCSLITGVTFQEGLEVVSGYAFYALSNFVDEIIIPNSVVNIGVSAFAHCGKLNEQILIPESVTQIGDRAFSNCSKIVGEIVIPDGVRSIGDSCFYGCDLIDGIKIGKDLEFIGKDAFKFSKKNVTSIAIDEDNNYFEGNKNALVEKSTKTLIAGCNNTDLTILQKISKIETYAFYYCQNLTGEIVFSADLTEISDYAFYYCKNITGGLTLSSNTTKIGRNAFYYCCGLTGDLIIPDNITEIGQSAFYYCEGFNGALSIGTGLTKIEDDVFCNCKGLTGDLIIPDNIKSIGGFAFAGCENFSGELIIGSQVTDIGNTAFHNCNKLIGDLVIPNSVISIGDSAFYNCFKKSKELIIPDSVKSMGNSVFMNCGFTSLKIGKGLESLNGTFNYIGKNFTNVEVSEENQNFKYEKNAFIDITNKILVFGNNNTDMSVLEEVSIIGSFAFYRCSGIKNVTFPNNITEIRGSAFDSCYNLQGELVLPNNLTLIDEFAFRGCSELVGDLIIPNGVTKIGRGAFNYCSKFTSVYLPSSVTNIPTWGVNPSYQGSPFANWDANTIIYTDIPDEASIPKGFEKYWKHCGSDNTLSVSYGVTLEEYLAIVNGSTNVVNKTDVHKVNKSKVGVFSEQEAFVKNQVFLGGKQEDFIVIDKKKIA